MAVGQKPVLLNDWVRMIDQIYGERNRRKNWSASDIWLHVVEEVGEVAEDYRKEDYAALLRDLPDVFVWLCSFSVRYNISNLAEVIWRKYPGICPYCHETQDCICVARNLRYNKDHPKLEAARKNTDWQRYTLNDWQAMFGRLYGNVNKASWHVPVGLHLFEEVGEVAKALLRDSWNDCLEEIADVFAWTFAIALKIPSNGSLADIIWDKYPGKCPKCDPKPEKPWSCTCP